MTNNTLMVFNFKEDRKKHSFKKHYMENSWAQMRNTALPD